MFKATFDFLNRIIELNTNSQRFFNFLKQHYHFFVVKGKINRPIKIEVFINPDEGLDAYARNFFLYIQSLLRSEYIMFHGAALVKDGKASIFLGHPESGKSTISAFAGQKGYKLLSDEICVVNKKHLTAAPFPIGPMKIHRPTYRFLQEHNLSVYRETRIKRKGKIAFKSKLEAKDLTEMNITIAEKETPFDRIFLFRKNGTPLTKLLPSLCYYYRHRNPSELMDDLKFLYYLLERYLSRTITPFRLNTPRQRRLTYKRMIELLGVSN